MISKKSDAEFDRELEMAELSIPRLLDDPHYGPLARRRGLDRRLDALRAEARERQERARARALRREASMAES
jgi:hypothetical protein